MKAPRIYTGAEARALREPATPGPWVTEHDDVGGGLTTVYGEVPGFGNRSVAEVRGQWVEDRADAELCAAAPDLAASVEHLENDRNELRRQLEELKGLVRHYLEAENTYDTCPEEQLLDATIAWQAALEMLEGYLVDEVVVMDS